MISVEEGGVLTAILTPKKGSLDLSGRLLPCNTQGFQILQSAGCRIAVVVKQPTAVQCEERP